MGLLQQTAEYMSVRSAQIPIDEFCDFSIDDL